MVGTFSDLPADKATGALELAYVTTRSEMAANQSKRQNNCGNALKQPDLPTYRRRGLNFRSIGRALAELLPQNNAIPRATYFLRFARHRIRAMGGNLDEGFSLVVATLNRKEFLSCAVSAVVTSTEVPFELIIMDNASDDGTGEMCQMLQAEHPGVVRSASR